VSDRSPPVAHAPGSPQFFPALVRRNGIGYDHIDSEKEAFMSATLTKPITPEEFLALPDSVRYELVNGELVERPMSALSSLVEGRVFKRVDDHCEKQKLGWVWPGTLSYQIFPDEPHKNRRPDVSFIRKERLALEDLDVGNLRIVPDLAVEVLSPNEKAYKVDEKIEEYLAAGVKLIWVINPETKTVLIHRADGTTTRLKNSDEISGEDVLEGFSCKVSEFFPT